MTLPDIQDQSDIRGIGIDAVGITGLRYPVTFDDGDLFQPGIAEVEVTVGLPPERRGTHMSRMVEAVEGELSIVDPFRLPTFLKHLAGMLDVNAVGLRVSMPVATRVAAPVSGREAWQAHDISIAGAVDDSGDVRTKITVASDVTSVCPCSKAISEYGAHNQRSLVSVTIDGSVDDPYPLAITQLVDLIRSVGSCAVFPIIKRVDERAVTMRAFNTPRFVEDIIRDLSQEFRARTIGHTIWVRNLESIHSHDAIARIAWTA